MDADRTTISFPSELQTYADSGATEHIFHFENAFAPGSLSSCTIKTIFLADKTTVNSIRHGNVFIPFDRNTLCLRNALYVSALRYNLVSTGRLADHGIESLYRRHYVLLKLEDCGTVIECGQQSVENGMYSLLSPHIAHVATVQAQSLDSLSTMWHCQLAQLRTYDCAQMHKHADGVPKLKKCLDICRACRLRKARRLPFRGHFERASRVGEVVHSNIFGKIEMSYPDS